KEPKSNPIYSWSRDCEERDPVCAFPELHGYRFWSKVAAVLHQPGEGLDSRGFENGRHRNLASGGALNFLHEARCQQRVSTQVEEIIVPADFANSEDILPNIDQ